jgi:GNAT superfamily N-acetyltransferase
LADAKTDGLTLSAARISIEVLNDTCRVEGFNCGEPARNSWLCTRAFSNQRTDDTRTYVAVTDGADVAGFYAITVGAIVRDLVPGPLRRNAPDPVSCILLGQLAVSLQWQGRGLGRDLVLHAMRQAVKVAELAGCRLFAVHPARPALVGYYGRFGFRSVDTTPPIMLMSLHAVRATLAAVVTRAAPPDR